MNAECSVLKDQQDLCSAVSFLGSLQLVYLYQIPATPRGLNNCMMHPVRNGNGDLREQCLAVLCTHMPRVAFVSGRDLGSRDYTWQTPPRLSRLTLTLQW
ncbi:hypothetical protein BaRGS_00016217 [Batillaria attramentaria]|uniref:Uncharacterized protein n=1 Tax=Batillaria attramentaria TaxID=370345 RepID=A0ABD0KZ87_9CAEN